MQQAIIAVLPSIQSELKAGEKLLWNGKPQSGLQVRASDALMIPFSLMWGGFAIFWEASVVSTPAPFFFKLWGIPFVLVGLYVIFGRFVLDAKSRDKTSYALTDQRVIIVSELFGRKVQSLSLRHLPELTLQEKSDKTGTVTLGSSSPFNAWGNFVGPNFFWPGSRQVQVPALEMIDRARHVYDLIQDAQHQVR